MTRLTLILFLTFTSLLSFSQLRADTGRVKLNELCDHFMQTFSDGKYSAAIQLLKKSSTLGNSFIDELDKTVNAQMTNMLSGGKKIVGYDLIEEKTIKNILVRRRYLLKLDLFYLTFDFYMYNNGTEWKISSFYYKDDQQDLF